MPSTPQATSKSDPFATAERFKVSAVQRAALESVLGALQAAQQRANLVFGEVKAALGVPQECAVLGLDERGLIVGMHANGSAKKETK